MHATLTFGLLLLLFQTPDSQPTFSARFGGESGDNGNVSQPDSQQPIQSSSFDGRPEPRRFEPNDSATRAMPGVSSRQFQQDESREYGRNTGPVQVPTRAIEPGYRADGFQEGERSGVQSIRSRVPGDSQVRPTAWQEDTGGRRFQQNQANAGAGYQTSNSLAKTIIEQALTPAGDNLLPGNPLTLKDALGKKFDRVGRREIAKEYWKSAVTLADFQFATEEVDYLSRITAPKSAEARALWQAEVAGADARVAEAKLSAMDAQETLRQKLGLSSEQLPIVVDTPWVGRYQTNYDEHASAGLVTENLKRIDRILPVMWQLVQRRADSVEASRIAFNELSRVYQGGGLPVGELLGMHRRLRDQRIAFLGAVRDYNYGIADYAMSTVNANGDVKKVAAMLLYDASIGLEEVGNGAIRQASATADAGYQRANAGYQRANAGYQRADAGYQREDRSTQQRANQPRLNQSRADQPPAIDRPAASSTNQFGIQPNVQPAVPIQNRGGFQPGGGNFGR